MESERNKLVSKETAGATSFLNKKNEKFDICCNKENKNLNEGLRFRSHKAKNYNVNIKQTQTNKNPKRVILKEIQNRKAESYNNKSIYLKNNNDFEVFTSSPVKSDLPKNINSRISIRSPIAKDSLPLIRTNLQTKNKVSPQCSPDMKFVTRERDFDSLLIDNDRNLSALCNTNNDSLFFNESDAFLNQSVDIFGEDLTEYKTESKINPNLTTNETGNFTPANTVLPNTSLKGIKLIHKYQGKCLVTNNDAEEASEIEKEPLKYKTENLLKSYSDQWGLSPPVFFVSKSNENNKKYLTTFKVPGAVHLDNSENYVFHQVLYSSPYLNYIIKHQLQKEYKNRLSDNFLMKYSVTDMNRSIVINWLIKLQTYMKVENVLVYTAVRMMDNAIDSIDIPLNMLQLVALASFWISLKYHAVNLKGAKWMVKQSGGAYAADQLIKMEQTVLEKISFNVQCVNSSTFVHYLILNLELVNADIIGHCSHYLIDCALLSGCFVHTLPSMISAAAVFTSLHLLKQYNEKLWLKLCFYCGYYSSDELIPVKENLMNILKQVNNPAFQCREPYYKYLSTRYCSVAHIVLDALENAV